MTPTKSQTVRPSGIVQSKDGRYFFWCCTVTGQKTFANLKRFEKLVKQYGSEEALFKTFVCKAAKKAESVDLPVAKGSSEPKAKKVKVSKDVSAPVAPKVEEKPVYPWQTNPNHFGNGKIIPVPVAVEELTKDSCAFPNRYLDEMCKGCSLYEKCALPTKYQPSDWEDKSKRKDREVKVKHMTYTQEGV